MTMNMESHLERLGDSLSALRAKVGAPQIQTGQRLVYLHGKTAGTRKKHKYIYSESWREES
jgi:hypothetical protein